MIPSLGVWMSSRSLGSACWQQASSDKHTGHCVVNFLLLILSHDLFPAPPPSLHLSPPPLQQSPPHLLLGVRPARRPYKHKQPLCVIKVESLAALLEVVVAKVIREMCRAQAKTNRDTRRAEIFRCHVVTGGFFLIGRAAAAHRRTNDSTFSTVCGHVTSRGSAWPCSAVVRSTSGLIKIK